MLARRVAAIAIVFGAFGLAAACDSSEERIPSHFEPAQPRDFNVTGRVRRGDELVEGALVRVDATAVDAGVLTQITNGDGFYRFENAPFRYDLHVVTGRELTSFLSVGKRYVEPLLAGTAPGRGYAAHVTVAVEPAPRAGRNIVFSASGADVLGVNGDVATGLDVSFRRFAMTAKTIDDTCTDGVKLHAVELSASGSLAEPTAYGKTCVSLTSGVAAAATIALSPIDASPATVVVRAPVPAGLAAEPVEILLDFGLRYLALPVVRAPLGGIARFVRVPDARYALRARARGAGVTSDSGHLYFEPNDVVIEPVLPPPLLVREVAFGGGGVSFALDEGAGVREVSVLATSPDAPSVRVVTTSAVVEMTDPAAFALGALRGKYTWSVRRWPDLPFSDSLAGTEARETYPSASVEGGPFEIAP